MTDSTNKGDHVLFETLTRSATIAKTATSEVGLNVLCHDGHASGKAFHDDRESFSV
jgi:hypothetical protein